MNDVAFMPTRQEWLDAQREIRDLKDELARARAELPKPTALPQPGSAERLRRIAEMDRRVTW